MVVVDKFGMVWIKEHVVMIMSEMSGMSLKTFNHHQWVLRTYDKKNEICTEGAG